jgi:hypothetical protein
VLQHVLHCSGRSVLAALSATLRELRLTMSRRLDKDGGGGQARLLILEGTHISTQIHTFECSLPNSSQSSASVIAPRDALLTSLAYLPNVPLVTRGCGLFASHFRLRFAISS